MQLGKLSAIDFTCGFACQMLTKELAIDPEAAHTLVLHSPRGIHAGYASRPELVTRAATGASGHIAKTFGVGEGRRR
jgi:hypothetical protein